MAERASCARALVLICSVLACGGRTADDSKPAEPSYGPPRANQASPPVASPPYRPQQSAPVNPPPPQQPPEPSPRPYREVPQEELAQAAAENVLAANCGQCHGSVLTPAQAQGGINYINDIDQLVAAGLIVPLSSATSRIIVVMRDGSMPPVDAGLPPVTDAEMQIVASYIDNPRFWPGSFTADSADAGLAAPSVDGGADGG